MSVHLTGLVIEMPWHCVYIWWTISKTMSFRKCKWFWWDYIRPYYCVYLWMMYVQMWFQEKSKGESWEFQFMNFSGSILNAINSKNDKFTWSKKVAEDQHFHSLSIHYKQKHAHTSTHTHTQTHIQKHVHTHTRTHVKHVSLDTNKSRSISDQHKTFHTHTNTCT